MSSVVRALPGKVEVLVSILRRERFFKKLPQLYNLWWKTGFYVKDNNLLHTNTRVQYVFTSCSQNTYQAIFRIYSIFLKDRYTAYIHRTCIDLSCVQSKVAIMYNSGVGGGGEVRYKVPPPPPCVELAECRELRTG